MAAARCRLAWWSLRPVEGVLLAEAAKVRRGTREGREDRKACRRHLLHMLREAMVVECAGEVRC